MCTQFLSLLCVACADGRTMLRVFERSRSMNRFVLYTSLLLVLLVDVTAFYFRGTLGIYFSIS